MLIVTKSNSLKNYQADSMVQGTTGWFNEQIGRVNLIAQTLAYEDYIGKRYDESEAFLADCIKENEAAYAYYFGLEDDRCIFSDGWKVPADYKATERDWYPDAFANPDKATVSAAYVDAETGRVVVTIAKAIVKDGKAAGVFAADFLRMTLSEWRMTCHQHHLLQYLSIRTERSLHIRTALTFRALMQMGK